MKEYNDTITDDELDELLKSTSPTVNDNNFSSWGSGFGSEHRDPNLVSIQIEVQDLLFRLEKYYRGEYKTKDNKGRTIWKVPTDKGLITLNEFGVTSLMEILNKYLDKNTILSSYKEQRIYEILADLGEEMILFVLCNGSTMGLNTPYKKSKVRLMITTTLHVVESAYRRSIDGKTMEEINRTKVVNQNESISNNPNPVTPTVHKKRGMFSIPGFG